MYSISGDLTKSSKKRRSICLIASSRKPDAPVVCCRDQKGVTAKNELTDFEDPVAPREKVLAHFGVSVIYLLKFSALCPNRRTVSSYVHPKKVIIIFKLLVHILRPAFVTVACEFVNLACRCSLIPVNSWGTVVGWYSERQLEISITSEMFLRPTKIAILVGCR